MSKVTIKSEVDINTLLAGVAKLKVKELEAFIQELSGVITRKKSKDKKYQEAALLLQHNQTVFDKEMRNRYAELAQKMEEETLTEDERKEFLILTQKEEKLRNERVKILIQLAQLREISLNEILKELGLNPVGDV